MAGVVLETLSWKKLIALSIVLLICQIGFFLIGGKIAPSPHHVQQLLATKCIDEHKHGGHNHKHKLFWPRGAGSCTSVSTFEDQKIEEDEIGANQIVFAFQFPIPREGKELKMNKWFQYMIAVLGFEIKYKENNPMVENAVIDMDSRIAARSGNSDWIEIARSNEQRKLDCHLGEKKENDYYDCNMTAFFELGSVYYEDYLVNIRIPVHNNSAKNWGIGKVEDIWMHVIHQTGGFTQVWFIMKTCVFPVVLGIMIWYWRRIQQLPRLPNLLEKILFTLGLALTFLNLPIEWLTLAFNIPFMSLLSDIRQGIFYSVLMAFWIIFLGEHMLDDYERNRLVMYWKHLSAVILGCICLFIFELCEK
ncbi:protein wntless homolog [Lingula anatina]|nr:protein wntless homolog [Lingula anatina]|eukprot:XP_023930088.1 protein wntless homolog [Lingula anatina]